MSAKRTRTSAKGRPVQAGPVSVWRRALAFAAGLLTVVGCSGGLFVFAPPLQVGFVCGVVVGLVAPTVSSAISSAVAAAVIGAFIGPANAWFPPESVNDRAAVAFTAALVAALVAAGVRYGLSRGAIRPRALVWVAVALLVGNVWATTLSANAEGAFDPVSQATMPSFNAQLAGDIPSQIADSDDAWFYRVYREVDAGTPYYESFDRALAENPRWSPASVMDYRMPTLFWLWAMLPGPAAVPYAFLICASAAVVAVAFLGSGFVKMPLVVPACAALASYFVYFPVQLVLFSAEAWAAAIGVVASAVYVASYRAEDRWKALTVTAVVLAVLATLARETIVFVPLAGLASAFVARNERTRFRVVAWGVGVAVLAAAYAAHIAVTRPLITPDPANSRLWKGSIAAVFAAVDYATDMLGQGGPWPFVLAALGVAGVVMLPDARLRTFAAISAVVPLASFLVLGNRAWYETTGTAINYWGATVMPLLLAYVSVAFRLVPGAAVEGQVGRLR